MIMQLAELAEQSISEGQVGGTLVLQAAPGISLVVPGDAWLLKADFSPQGSDLLLTGPDGARVLVRDYFNLDNPPDLLTEAGGIIPAELAIKLAGPTAPGQFALLENGPFAELAQGSESIGRVEATDGLVEAIHTDGTKVELAKGDDIFQGDTLVTAKGAAIGITFLDDTTFSLGEEGRMVIDEMVYDAETQEGAFSANLVQGVFSFVSGQIAKTGPEAMTVSTPVATIGIRGTRVAGRAAQEGAENTISLLPETDAQGNQFVGQLLVTNQGGTVTLSSIGATVQMTSAFQPPPPPVIFSPQQIQQNFGATLTTLSTAAAAKAEAAAAENSAQAEQAQAEAAQAGAEAEAAAAEAEAAQAQAEAAAAEAEASGDPEAIAAAEAAAAEAEAKAAEVEAKVAEAEAKVAEAEAAQAEAETSQAEAEHANAEMQTQVQAFAVFGQQSGDGPGPGGPGSDGPPPGGDAINQAAEAAARQAIEDGASPEDVFAAAADAAAAQLAAEGDSPESIAAERAVAEQAYNDALASGASPEEAMAAALAATDAQFGGPDGGFTEGGGDPNAQAGTGDQFAQAGAGEQNATGGFTGDPNTNGGGNEGSGDGFGNYDNFFGAGDPFTSNGGLFGGDPYGGGFYGEPLYGGGGLDTFGDQFFSDTFDPLLGDIFNLGNVFDAIDHTDDVQNTQPVASQDVFNEFRVGTTAPETLTGTSLNTNFYFDYAAIGGADYVVGTGGTNQMAFDSLNDIVLKFTIDGTVPTTGAVDIQLGNITGTNPGTYTLSSYSGASSSTINFTNVGQYLFADDVVPSLSGDYTTHSGQDLTATPSDGDAGDVIVFPTLEISDIGYVAAGGAGIDTFNLEDSAMAGIIAFGKGGGDTFNISVAMDALLIGGITTTDNKDNDADDIPDQYINSFSYSSMYSGTTGISADIFSFYDSSDAKYETTAVVSDSATGIAMNNMLWDVGSFTGSAGNDSLSLHGAKLNTLDGGAGNDNIVVNSTTKILTLNNAGGTDTLTTTGADSDSTEGDMDLSTTAITGLTSITLNNGNANTAGTTTLTVNNATSFASGTTISYGVNTNHAHIESDNGMDLSNVTLSNTDAVLLDTGNDGISTLTMNASTNFGSSAIEIRSLEGTTGADNDLITSAFGMSLSNAQISGISTVTFNTGVSTATLSVNATTDFTYDATATNNVTINGTGGGTSNIVSTSGMNLTDVTLSNIDTVTIDGGAGTSTLTIDGGTNLSTAAISGGGTDDQIVFNETGTYSIANNVTSGIATIQFAGNGANSLQINQTNNAVVATITGNTGSDTLTTAETTLDFSGSTMTSIDNITTTNTTGTAFTGTGGNDTITGFTGVDTLNGGGGVDTLLGGNNNDTLNGGAGNDFLTGGTGKDTLTGGTGADTFIYTTTSDTVKNIWIDVLTDFKVSEGDIIDLSGLSTITEAEMDAANTLTNVGASGFADAGAALSDATWSTNNIQVVAGTMVQFGTTDGKTNLFIQSDTAGSLYSTGDIILAFDATSDLTGFGDASVVGG